MTTTMPPEYDVRYQRAVQLSRLIRDHGHEAMARPDGTISATCVVMARDGAAFLETTILPARRAAVRDWLGY